MRNTVLALTLVFGSTSLAMPASQVLKGGEEETGPYELVANWPQPFASPGYVMGSNPAIFAESANRVFLGIRGELKLPEKLSRGFNGTWGSLDQRATVPTPEMRNCIVVIDAGGKMVESWTQWDHLFAGRGPHKIRINPRDPERHVWVVLDSRHQILEFTNDGKTMVRTLGEADVPGDDETHFGQPQDLTWLPDGSMLVADGLTNSRVVKLDKNGKFLMSWGSKGNGPGQFSGLHGIEVDRNRRVYVADRGNSRIQVFDENGKHLDTWPGIRFPDHITVTPDQQVWVNDGTTEKFLKYDTTGRLLYSWGTQGTFAGAHWELHQISIDPDGNLYTADSYVGRAQKFRPRPESNRSQLIAPIPLAPKATF
jgi:DNA-binding beta-propeller fold protein YncE